MPSAEEKVKNDNAKNELIDLKLTGLSIILEPRPINPVFLQNPIFYPRRPMSAIPSTSYQVDKTTKNPPWNRPQSADNKGIHKKNLRFNKHKNKKVTNSNSLTSLPERSSEVDDRRDSLNISSENSTPDLYSSNTNLTSNFRQPYKNRLEHKSYDDIINIKFRRWFPLANQQNKSTTNQILSCWNNPLPSCSKKDEIIENDNSNFSKSMCSNYSDEQQSEFKENSICDNDSIKRLLDSSENMRNKTPELSESFIRKVNEEINKHCNTENINSEDDKQMIKINDKEIIKLNTCLKNNGNETKTEDKKIVKKVTINDPITLPEIPGIDETIPPVTEQSNEAASKHADILTWIDKNDYVGTKETPRKNSTYDDILDMIKVIEKEEIESIKLDNLSTSRSTNTSACSNVATRDILTFLDQVDKGETEEIVTKANISSEKPKESRLGNYMNMDSAELAKKLMSLSLELEEKNELLEKTNTSLVELQDKFEKQKIESNNTIKRHQKFIDQLLSEKRILGDNCAAMVREMETKHLKEMKLLEEKHNIELKKQQDKLMASEKIKRERWVDEKTKKIKELTVKGLEPELNRMATIHQEELFEIRRSHEKELIELEAVWSRRLSQCREQSLKDRETAVQQERDAARIKLEHELNDMEKSYQEHRKRLMGEVREEKEKLEKELKELTLEKEKMLDEKLRKINDEMKLKIIEEKKKYENDVNNMKEMLEKEKQEWIKNQNISFLEKEKMIKESMKKERDRHIEAVIRKLDSEMVEKENMAQNKLSKTKEQFQTELKELEKEKENIKRKLKDSIAEQIKYEETLNKIKSELMQTKNESEIIKQMYEKIKNESKNWEMTIRKEMTAQIANLQNNLAEERARKENLLTLHNEEKERELQQVYKRVRDAVEKKDEMIKIFQKQRDAALEQCSQLEQLLEQQRKQFSVKHKLK